MQVQTEQMGDIHHYAWRARRRNQTAYIAPRDGERFGTWTRDQCATEDCVEVRRCCRTPTSKRRHVLDVTAATIILGTASCLDYVEVRALLLLLLKSTHLLVW